MNTIHLAEPREQNWEQFLNQTLTPFWQQNCQANQFQTQDGLTLHYAYIKAPDAKGLVILLPGRVETYPKYQEVIYDLFQAGLSVLTLDHRGQGMSSRMLSNPEKGYVRQFADYADDLQAIIEHSQLLKKHDKVHCLAHSMGAAIALTWISKYQPNLSSLILNAPMLGINAGPLSQKSAYYVAKIADDICKLFCKEPPYFIGQHGYQKQAFVGNQLCSSEKRFDLTHSLQARYKLGGVTTRWLEQALIIINQAPDIAQYIQYPTLMLQAENEQIVSVQAQNNWIAAAKNQGVQVETLNLKNARHEILMETDDIRQQAMARIIEFIYQSN